MMKQWSIRLLLLAAICLSVIQVTQAEAAQSPKRTTAVSKKVKPSKQYSKRVVATSLKSSEVGTEREAMLVVNAKTGKVLYNKNAGDTRYPASLTKMMTLYLTFDALKNRQIKLTDNLAISQKASAQPQTNLALRSGMSVDVRTLIESLVVRSANDSAMVLAEKIGGTEWNFALMMTQKARALGMKNTVFRNPNGLPDNRQYTTAYDMARLAIALRRDFPEYYHYFSEQSFDYNGKTYLGHNRLLGRYQGVDGVKTGFIRASGFNLVTSVKRDGYNLVAVVMGGSTAAARDQQMINLLDRTFASLPGKESSSAEINDKLQRVQIASK